MTIAALDLTKLAKLAAWTRLMFSVSLAAAEEAGNRDNKKMSIVQGNYPSIRRPIMMGGTGGGNYMICSMSLLPWTPVFVHRLSIGNAEEMFLSQEAQPGRWRCKEKLRMYARQT